MKPIRFRQWGSTLLAPGIRRSRQCQCLLRRAPCYNIASRLQSTAQLLAQPSEAGSPVVRKRGRPRRKAIDQLSESTTAAVASNTSPSTVPHQSDDEPIMWQPDQPIAVSTQEPLEIKERRADVTESTFRKEKLPSPPANTPSPKLSALHARLALSSRIPIQTLARCLVHETADPDYRFNNRLLARLGHQLLGYQLAEYLICHYPRLPMAVLSAAMDAYIGDLALKNVAREWGVEAAAEPGGEVDPGLLQFRWELPTKQVKEEVVRSLQRFAKSRAAQAINRAPQNTKSSTDPLTTTLEEASRSFVRALSAAIYLHCGAVASQDFVKSHILSRQLDLASLFTFKQPTRELSRLCAREGFEPPVARLISETGRLSRHPVFVVGIFSGQDKLGENAGASLDEARFRAATNALRGWYLYSPKTETGEVRVPSVTIGEGDTGTWQPVHVDEGDIIV